MPFAKSIDPWVGRGPGRSPPRYLAPWAALPVFPRGDSIATQVCLVNQNGSIHAVHS